MRIRRPVAAAAAALLLGTGVATATAGTAMAHERPGHSQGPQPGQGNQGDRGQETRDRWLESHVTRTVAPEAVSALRASLESAR
ncbi:MAG: hypothetical protein ACR2KE_01775, partial [Candidatus Nanopelagicales bacterium]